MPIKEYCTKSHIRIPIALQWMFPTPLAILLFIAPESPWWLVRKGRLAEAETQRRRESAAAFSEGLANQGRILPRHAPMVTELLLALPADGEVSFAEGQISRKAAPEALFREFLESLPEAIDFAEKSGSDTPDVPADVLLPPGCSASADRLQALARAKAYQRQHQCDFSEAVKAVTTQ